MGRILEKQGWHLGALTILIAGVWYAGRLEGVLSGEWLRVGTAVWYVLAVLVGIIHQVYVVIGWRSELHYKWITTTFGEKGFSYFETIFLLLLVGRPLLLAALGIANAGTLSGNRALYTILGSLLLVPTAYTMHSVLVYFGIRRAAGIDHFDPSYKDVPFVKQGVYKYVSNAIYKLLFLGFWAIALLAASKAALIVAGFYHVYIWVHYVTTERPDFAVIYGDQRAQ